MSRLPAAVLTLLLVGCAHAPAAPEARPLTLAESLAVLPDAPVNGPKLEGPVYADKVVMIFFLASWCLPCLGELELMKQLQIELAPKGYATLAVGMDLDGRKTLRPFAEEAALPYPLLVATPELLAGQTVFGPVRELPERLLFGRDGALLFAFSGVVEASKLAKAVRQVVEQGAGGQAR